MKPDDLERHLQRQPLRQLPAEWRANILSAARDAALPQHAPRTALHVQRSLLSAFFSQLSSLLWPHPAAWVGLAAVWLAVVGLNIGTRLAFPPLARRTSPPNPAVFVNFQEQARLLAELLGPREAPVAERPKHGLPRPRTEREPRQLMA